jgi:hypothetical protein
MALAPAAHDARQGHSGKQPRCKGGAFVDHARGHDRPVFEQSINGLLGHKIRAGDGERRRFGKPLLAICPGKEIRICDAGT